MIMITQDKKRKAEDMEDRPASARRAANIPR